MSKRLASLFVFALVAMPAVSYGDSWTDGQEEWARHGSRHGTWDCFGHCAGGAAHRASAPRPRASRASFDGTWIVSADGPCLAAGSSQVMISGGRIMGQNGGGGHVTPGGAITTVSNINGVTVLGEGQIEGRSASGIYRQSDGCSSSWSAVRL